MSHASTTKALSYFGPKIDYLRQSHPNIPLVLAEVGQALPGKKGAFDISQETSLGGGLWGIDFMCKAMAIVCLSKRLTCSVLAQHFLLRIALRSRPISLIVFSGFNRDCWASTLSLAPSSLFSPPILIMPGC